MEAIHRLNDFVGGTSCLREREREKIVRGLPDLGVGERGLCMREREREWRERGGVAGGGS